MTSRLTPRFNPEGVEVLLDKLRTFMKSVMRAAARVAPANR